MYGSWRIGHRTEAWRGSRIEVVRSIARAVVDGTRSTHVISEEVVGLGRSSGSGATPRSQRSHGKKVRTEGAEPGGGSGECGRAWSRMLVALTAPPNRQSRHVSITVVILGTRDEPIRLMYYVVPRPYSLCILSSTDPVYPQPTAFTPDSTSNRVPNGLRFPAYMNCVPYARLTHSILRE